MSTRMPRAPPRVHHAFKGGLSASEARDGASWAGPGAGRLWQDDTVTVVTVPVTD